ncbi:MAG: class I SAM-dependent methyltransferase [Acidobacteria bacterium]|nr:class I SAM-dependent methyltransferase [Acidobacteriota bacterium]
MTFHDHFSARASIYARARPTYPPSLFAELAALSPSLSLAWDCGTGNGQAARGLAVHFSRVVATDPSAPQLAQAPSDPKIEFRLAEERNSGLPARSVDLVTAAQAAHWFDLEAFYAEARRVLRPRGLIAIWCYNLLRIAPDIDDLITHFYAVTVGPFWPPERKHTEAGYRTLPFPFPELPFPTVIMEQQWGLDELGAYLRSWSSVVRFIEKLGTDPVEPLLRDLLPVWGSPDQKKRVEWPLAGRIGRLPTS